MPKYTDQKQIERQWYIIKLLAQNPQGYSQAELAVKVSRTDYKASRATIMNDLDDLSEAGFIYQDGDDARPVYKLFKEGLFNIHDLDLDIDELLGLYFLREIVKPFVNSAIGGNAYSIVNRIVDSMPTPNKEFMEQVASYLKIDLNDLSSDRIISGDIMERLQKAVDDRHTVRMRYYSFTSDEESVREMDPYVLFFKNGYYYVVGYCHKDNDIREFRIDRIRWLEILDKCFDIDPGFSYEQYTDYVWDILKGSGHYTVEVRFFGKGARLVREYEYKRADRLIDQPDGSVIFIKTVSSLEEITRWILSYGSDAVVLKPEQLVNTIKEQAHEMYCRYQY